MAIRNKSVNIKVDKNFFDNFFEPHRRNLGTQLGINFSQPKFTEYLYRSGAKIVYPKLKKEFIPKKPKFGGVKFSFSL